VQQSSHLSPESDSAKLPNYDSRMPLFSLGERRIELVGANHYIAYDATLVGSITLHANVNIWFKVVIRAENDRITIGEGTNVQDASVLHVDPGYPMTLGRMVSIGHKVMLHGCTIGEGTLIGINSVVMNGARIGAHTLIGANTLIPEGKEIPEGVLVLGSPGKIVRDLKQEEKDYLLKIAQGYVERSRFYKENLKQT
jgi:carbonic anhydrase/acetyltransferase-like protein (isoleucine patch superfamily)